MLRVDDLVGLEAGGWLGGSEEGGGVGEWREEDERSIGALGDDEHDDERNEGSRGGESGEDEGR